MPQVGKRTELVGAIGGFISYARKTSERRIVGDHRASLASGPTQGERRQAPDTDQKRVRRHRPRTQERRPLADVAQGDRGGSGTTCWRRLRNWQTSAVWWRLHRILLDHLGRADSIDWSRASLDSASIPAKRGAKRPVPTLWLAVAPARSGTSSPTRVVYRWP